MTHGVICLFRGVSLKCQLILRQNKSFSILHKRRSSGDSSQIVASNYYEEKYDGIRNRLIAIPYLDLLNKEEDRFKHDLCYDDVESLKDFGNWNSKVFDYNARVAGLYIAGTFIKAYCVYGFSLNDTNWNQWDSDKWRSAAILAWCIEMIASCIIIFDDIVDKSVNRNRNLCWYRKSEIGLSAINDALVLQWNTYKVLRKHFGELKCYLNLIHEFNEENRRLAYGQSLDTYNNANLKSKLEKFTFEKYKVYAENKIISLCYFFPVHLAMHLTGEYSTEESDFMKKICWKIGLYLQIQDDSLDLVSPIEFKGVKGSDIRYGKVTWFAIKFLENASDSMQRQFSEHYGVDDDYAVDNILELYEKSKMIERFHEFEEQVYKEISTLIEYTDDTKGGFFYDLFHTAQARIKE